MKLQRIARKAFSTASQLAQKVRKEDIEKIGQKAIHHGKMINDAITDENIRKTNNTLKDVGSRTTEIAGKAADLGDKVGNVADAIGFKNTATRVRQFSKLARDVNEKGKKAGEFLGYS